MEALVGDQLRFTPGGRLYSVEVDGNPLPVLIPAELREINIRKGQRYRFRVEVGDKGIIKALQVQEA
jgi:hypothetical protein